MRRRPRAFDLFSLSFLDVISCGFGAVVLLVLISKYAEVPVTEGPGDAARMLHQVIEAEASVEDLKALVASRQEDLAETTARLAQLQETAAEAKTRLAANADLAKRLDEDVVGLKIVKSTLERQARAAISQATAVRRDDEVGGIPVDSDYVVFIVDTSGSMQKIWARVIREIENVIRIHPRIRGFQILNDNGMHLIDGYEGRWIPDTPGRRASVIDLLQTWKSTSNSSPVEGLEVALKRYVKPSEKVSIYIFGDEYTGSSYDPVIDALVALNTNRLSGRRLARVHAVGFLSSQSTARFATLMREVTRRNDGTFVALPP